jgi:hypothetical protein
VGLAFDSSGVLYEALASGNAIEKISSTGTLLGFLSTPGTFSSPAFIAIQQVPEPATWILVALGAVALLGSRRLRRRSL